MSRPLTWFAFAAAVLSPSADAQCLVDKLYSGAAQPGDNFGFDVALDGDVGLVASLESGAPGVGEVTVIERVAGAWVRTAKLEPSDGNPGDWFGYSVALEDGVAIVGAPYADTGVADTGAAYVFELQAGAWVQTAKLVPADVEFDDLLGFRVALSQGTALVTSYYDDDQGEKSGSVLVYEHLGSAWVQVAKLTASDGEQVDFFGSALSIDGATAVIGAFADDDPVAHDGGSAYVFERVGGAWTETQKLVPPDLAAGDAFGAAVALSGDRLLISSLRDDGPGANAGAVYAFERSAGAWTQVQKFQPEEINAGDEFGLKLSISGDTALIASMFDDSFTGSVYVYEHQGASWVEVGKMTDDDGAPGDRFGGATALSGDTALVGALQDGGAAAGSGTAFVFSVAELCAAVVGYGCGVNPLGSLTVSDAPALGATLTLGVDAPLGAFAPGAPAFLALATAPDAAYPCGTLLPGFGAGATDGELLLAVSPAPFLVASGGPWPGTGSPVEFALPLPADDALIGASLFAQGVLVAPSGGASPAMLTDAFELRLGL